MRSLFTSLRSRRRGDGESGQVLILFAAGLVAFIGLVGMSVDIGYLVYMRTDLQKVADAAALAGSQDLPGSTADATESANFYAAENAGGVSTEVTFTGTDTIHVKASKKIDFFFIQVLGIDSATPSAKATAFAEEEVVTGFRLQSTAPFILWGGSRENEVNPGDENCPYHVCVGKSYTFMDTTWMSANGKPTAPDWTANDSNNFKGDINHGDGNPVVHIGDDLNVVDSVGGLGSVEVPSPGDIIVIPVVSEARGNSDNRTYTVAAWVMVQVNNGCNKNGCKGTILPGQPAAAGAVGGGSVAPPPDLVYTRTDGRLTE